MPIVEPLCAANTYYTIILLPYVQNYIHNVQIIIITLFTKHVRKHLVHYFVMHNVNILPCLHSAQLTLIIPS